MFVVLAPFVILEELPMSQAGPEAPATPTLAQPEAAAQVDDNRAYCRPNFWAE